MSKLISGPEFIFSRVCEASRRPILEFENRMNKRDDAVLDLRVELCYFDGAQSMLQPICFGDWC